LPWFICLSCSPTWMHEASTPRSGTWR
jgi:hypothetical protein